MAKNTDDKILKAFDNLVAKYGYQGTTTKKIAETAGVNESTVFRHFATKDDILKAHLQRTQEEMEETVANLTMSKDIENDIVKMGGVYLDFVKHHKATFLIGIRDSYLYPQVQPAIQQIPEKMIDLLQKRFIKEYGLKNKQHLLTLLQDFFLILFGRATMELTYPQSKLVNSDDQFVERNFRFLVHSFIKELK